MGKSNEHASLIREAAAVSEERAKDPDDQIGFVRREIDSGHKRLFLKLLVPLTICFALLSIVAFWLTNT